MNKARRVAVVLTVKNDAAGAAETLQSLLDQTRRPDEMVIVDGGSTDGTLNMLRSFAARDSRIRVIEAPGANIARGRNLGTAAATTEIIATTDGGCRAEPTWLAELMRPFEADEGVEFVGGLYAIAPQSLLESVVGLCTMRGQWEAVDPARFNPSGRSQAYTKALWRRAGGWPEWIHYSEDTLYSMRLRELAEGRALAERAIVHWRPRASLSAIGRQFYHYGTGRGHTQIGAADFAYHLRNMGLLLLACAAALFDDRLWLLVIAGFLYFFVWSFHGKAWRAMRHTGRRSAYPLALLVLWVVLFSNTWGYVVGTMQRWRDRERFVGRRARWEMNQAEVSG